MRCAEFGQLWLNPIMSFVSLLTRVPGERKSLVHYVVHFCTPMKEVRRPHTAIPPHATCSGCPPRASPTGPGRPLSGRSELPSGPPLAEAPHNSATAEQSGRPQHVADKRRETHARRTRQALACWILLQ